MPLPDDFRDMLTTDGVWERHVDRDTWGNETYDPPVSAKCYVMSQDTQFGREDGQHQQEGESVITVSVITDALGITPKDKFSVGGTTYYVTGVDTPKDEFGVDLMHTITGSTAKKG